jgi:2-dehydropantoate 2-reductase
VREERGRGLGFRQDMSRDRAHKPSMLQDIEAHRPTEVKAILCAIGRQGRSANVVTPVIDILASLVRIIDQTNICA